jgi:hypothetical protein
LGIHWAHGVILSFWVGNESDFKAFQSVAWVPLQKNKSENFSKLNVKVNFFRKLFEQSWIIRNAFRPSLTLFFITLAFRQSAMAPLGGATAEAFSLSPEHAHLPILAQRANFVQLMAGTFFITQNPGKHWSKRAPGANLSSMNS